MAGQLDYPGYLTVDTGTRTLMTLDTTPAAAYMWRSLGSFSGGPAIFLNSVYTECQLNTESASDPGQVTFAMMHTSGG